MTINVYIRCRHCQKQFEFAVDTLGYQAWIMGMCIQNALPKLSDSQRELLISQTCDKCWKEMFSEEQSDEEAFDEAIDYNPDNIDAFLYNEDCGDR